MNKLVKVIFGVALFSMLTAGVSLAEWSACTPKAIGPAGDVVRLQVEGCNVDPSAGLGWVTLASTGTDQMMAAILTAMSLGKPVAVNTSGAKEGTYNIVDSVIFTN